MSDLIVLTCPNICKASPKEFMGIPQAASLMPPARTSRWPLEIAGGFPHATQVQESGTEHRQVLLEAQDQPLDGGSSGHPPLGRENMRNKN